MRRMIWQVPSGSWKGEYTNDVYTRCATFIITGKEKAFSASYAEIHLGAADDEEPSPKANHREEMAYGSQATRKPTQTARDT